MRVRLGVVLVAALAVLVVAAEAGALSGRVLVSPASPLVGAKTTIEVRVSAQQAGKLPAALFANVVSPQGAALRVRLGRAGGHVWRAAFVFARAGRWKLRVVDSRGSVVGVATVPVRKP